ncbi:hypothetical protein FACS1894217_04060 [Clostridia bacterium]|nr:hypothetical protein FACS1894217_04060 [Clostridia bacterium]
MIHPLLTEANNLLRDGGLEYAFCGGYAIELFLNKTVRNHGDIDVSVFWQDRDRIILYMQSLGWQVFEMCGGGMAHRITNVADQRKIKRNIFCFKDNCELVALSPAEESDMFRLDFDHSGQSKLNFIEFLFNDKNDENFLYARNPAVALPMNKAIMQYGELPYLAPELILLYKSTDTEREGYQQDFDVTFPEMNDEQRYWLLSALKEMYPDGHKWIPQDVAFWSAIDTLILQSEIVIDRPKGTKHPHYDFIYPLDYGYLKDTTSMDGGGIDVWCGSLLDAKCDAVICTVDLLKRDSEIKLLIGCTKDEKAVVAHFHNDSEYMKGVMIRRDRL